MRRLRKGEWITALGGVILLVSLFVPWYDEGATDPNGWQAFAVADVIFALVGVAAVLLLVVTASQPTPAVPIAMASLVALAALVSVVLALIHELDLPADASGRQLGVGMGLVGSVLIFLGACFAMRDERRSAEGRHVDLTGMPTAGPPSIEATPAPRPRP